MLSGNLPYLHQLRDMTKTNTNSYQYSPIGDEVYRDCEAAVEVYGTYRNHTTRTSSTTFKGKTWKEIDEDEGYDIVAVATGDTRPIREWGEPYRLKDVTRRHRDARETYKLLKPMQIGKALYAGDYCVISPNYYTENTEEHCGHGDYCGYCGAFNGPQGEYRMGFDCYNCGCN